jgi:chromosome segregation ATPase
MNQQNVPQEDRIDSLSRKLWETTKSWQQQFVTLGERINQLEQKRPVSQPEIAGAEVKALRAELAEIGKEVEALRIQVEQLSQDTGISRSLGGFGERLVIMLADLVASRIKR